MVPDVIIGYKYRCSSKSIEGGLAHQLHYGCEPDSAAAGGEECLRIVK
jgi:hypothetical protein